MRSEVETLETWAASEAVPGGIGARVAGEVCCGGVDERLEGPRGTAWGVIGLPRRWA